MKEETGRSLWVLVSPAGFQFAVAFASPVTEVVTLPCVLLPIKKDAEYLCSLKPSASYIIQAQAGFEPF
ncbi:hypothetical protein D3H65_07415 [Paraflavitalea soli]|uniref:Uncharacterized protein n=1 Tax=Paraflavitalea soli TaxID=2315862 RepID=A0A3B7MLC1_9BACT|nr:hypothetical protein D3H65_07415 [Paraflavitalea soli]